MVKSGIVFYVLFNKHSSAKWANIVNAMGKWAMADVFAISIFIAFLGAKAMKNTSAALEPGFYYFTAYVLLSAIVGYLLPQNPKIIGSSNL